MDKSIFPSIKLCAWASVGGFVSGLLAAKTGLAFWTASIVVLAAILACSYLTNMWRMALFMFAVEKDYKEVSAFVESHGNFLVVGDRNYVKAIAGLAYRLPRGIIVDSRRADYFCMLDGRTEKKIMAKYNKSKTNNALYRVLEWLF